MAKLKPKTNRRRGLALTELAIVLPLLMWLTLGIMEYGWMFLKAHQVANAARQGARVGARADALAGDVTAAVNTAMVAAGIPVGNFVITMTPNDPTSLDAGEQFSVRVQVTYTDVDLGLPLVPTPTNLTSEVTMAREGT